MHKLLFDQNLSYRILEKIKDIFPESNHVRLLELDKADDITIWQFAQKNNYHIVTKDTDFNIFTLLYGYPPKVILIDTGNTTTNAIVDLLHKKKDIIYAFLENIKVDILQLK